jgi:hypothetical protein
MFLNFAFVFAPAQAAVAYSRTKGRLRFTTSIAPRSAATTKRMTLNPLSAHFIAVRVPPGTKALELVATGIDQPDPLQTLLVGARLGRRATVTFARDVSPCVTTFPTGREGTVGYGTFTDRLAVNFRSARERSTSILVVANRTDRPVPYLLSYRTLAVPVAAPSPTNGSGPDVSAGFCKHQAGDFVGGIASDAEGDAGLGAPDITEINVGRLTRGNSRPFTTFAVKIPNRRDLRDGDQILMLLDIDKNPDTGCLLGAERAILVGGVAGPDVYGLGRCVGTDMKYSETPSGTFQARYDETNRQLVLMATPSDFGGASSFAFTLASLWKDPESGEVRLDATAGYCFPGCDGALR